MNKMNEVFESFKEKISVDKFLEYVNAFDFATDYIDDGGQRRRALATNKQILDMYDTLSKQEQQRALKTMIKRYGPVIVNRHFE